MILTGDAARNFCRQPDKDKRVILLFGPDRGLVAQTGQSLIAHWMGDESDPMRLTRLGEDSLGDRLFDALQACPLFGSGEPIVHMRLENERVSSLLLSALEAITQERLSLSGYWLIEAGDLPKKSRLRQGFSQSKSAQALELLQDEAGDVLPLIQAAFDEETSLGMSEEAANLCAQILAGNRALAVSEIEKLQLYAQDLERPLNVQDISALLMLGQSKDSGQAADAALAGDSLASDRALSRYLQSGGAAISGLRTLYFRLMRLTQAQAGDSWLRPPIGAADRPLFEQARRYWSTGRLVRAMCAVREAERNCKQAGLSDRAVLIRLLADVAARRI